jgi:hypothetical protein
MVSRPGVSRPPPIQTHLHDGQRRGGQVQAVHVVLAERRQPHLRGRSHGADLDEGMRQIKTARRAGAWTGCGAWLGRACCIFVHVVLAEHRQPHLTARGRGLSGGDHSFRVLRMKNPKTLKTPNPFDVEGGTTARNMWRGSKGTHGDGLEDAGHMEINKKQTHVAHLGVEGAWATGHGSGHPTQRREKQRVVGLEPKTTLNNFSPLQATTLQYK